MRIDSISDVMTLLRAAEESLPVASWIHSGIPVWPVVRIHLFFRLSSRVIPGYRQELPPEVSSRIRRTVLRLGALVRPFLRGRQTWNASRIQGRSDILFYGDGVSRSLVSGVWWDHFCDPIRYYLDSAGLKSLMWEPLRSSQAFRRTPFPSYDIQPFIDAGRWKARIRSCWRPVDPPFSCDLEQMMKRFLPEADSKAEMWQILRNIFLIEELSAGFSAWLKGIQPKAAFIVEYYNVAGMAFCLACHRLGIPVADIQHGLQGPLHAAYGRWNKVPVGGYSLLPSAFWCWGEREAASIRAWSEDTPHRAIPAGNLWMEAWQKGTLPFVADYDQTVNALLCQKDERPKLLLTLPWGNPDEVISDTLGEVIRRHQDAFFWWIRIHPCSRGRERDFERRLQDLGVLSYQLRSPSELPLYALLRNADLHVTEYSSTLLEARQFGLPTVVLNHLGAELFSEELNDGAGAVCLSPSSFADIVKISLKGRKFQRTRGNEAAGSLRESLFHRISELAGEVFGT